MQHISCGMAVMMSLDWTGGSVGLGLGHSGDTMRMV
jgi:hypothetical protein